LARFNFRGDPVDEEQLNTGVGAMLVAFRTVEIPRSDQIAMLEETLRRLRTEESIEEAALTGLMGGGISEG
jgi:hypothetical protein